MAPIIKKILMGSLTLIFSAACSTGLKYEGAVESEARGAKGDRVFVIVEYAPDKKDITDSMIGKSIRQEVESWLNTSGFRLVKEARKADFIAQFEIDEKNKTVYVPGQTYSVPVYGTQQSTTTTFQNQYGQNLGQMTTAPTNPFQPSGFTTQYREGYNQELNFQWLFLRVYQQIAFEGMNVLSVAQVYPETANVRMINDTNQLKLAVKKLLSNSAFSVMTRAEPAINQKDDPGCSYRFGFTWDTETRTKIKEFAIDSQASKHGLKVGDEILSIDGRDPKQNAGEKADEGQVSEFEIKRDGKQFKLKVPRTKICR